MTQESATTGVARRGRFDTRRHKKNKYTLYQRAIQAPEEDVDLYLSMVARLRGPDAKVPLVLREDFCGTYAFACAWIKKGPGKSALCIDLDPEPLAYGKKNNESLLSSSEKKRLKILRQNAISVTHPKADLTIAGNFSFFIFKEWDTLVAYFKKAHQSMSRGGLFFLEIAGGSDFTVKSKESRKVNFPDTGKFTYFWEQKSFDPITQEALYAIHFKCEDGTLIKDAFTYDWRLWSIPEIRLALKQAGFKKTHVLWEKESKGEGTGEYQPVEKAKNTDFWLSYVVGEK